MMKQEWRQNLSHYEEFTRMAAARSANYHQTHVSRQLKHNYNNDGHEDDSNGDDGDADQVKKVQRGAGEGLREPPLSHILEPCVARKVYQATFKVYTFTK